MIAKDLPFSDAEYARRLAKTRAAMAARGIEVLFVTDPSNQHWLTGYDGWSFYVHQGVIVLPEADPVWWGRNQDANGAVRTVWMTDDRVIGYADNYVQSTERHPMQDLVERLRGMGLFLLECYYKCPFWPNLVKEFENVLKYAVFSHTSLEPSGKPDGL